jgi:hypothetical protein
MWFRKQDVDGDLDHELRFHPKNRVDATIAVEMWEGVRRKFVLRKLFLLGLQHSAGWRREPELIVREARGARRLGSSKMPVLLAISPVACDFQPERISRRIVNTQLVAAGRRLRHLQGLIAGALPAGDRRLCFRFCRRRILFIIADEVAFVVNATRNLLVVFLTGGVISKLSSARICQNEVGAPMERNQQRRSICSLAGLHFGWRNLALFLRCGSLAGPGNSLLPARGCQEQPDQQARSYPEFRLHGGKLGPNLPSFTNYLHATTTGLVPRDPRPATELRHKKYEPVGIGRPVAVCIASARDGTIST